MKRKFSISTETDEDGYYFVEDQETGERSEKCRVRWRDGVWQYGLLLDVQTADGGANPEQGK